MKHLCKKRKTRKRNRIMKNFPTYSIARKFDVVKCIQFKKSNSVTFCYAITLNMETFSVFFFYFFLLLCYFVFHTIYININIMYPISHDAFYFK